MSKESETLWNEWLKTPEAKGYEGGWGDLWNQLLAARGREWVAEKMIASRDAEIARLRAANAKLLAACEMYDAEWTKSAPRGPDGDANRLGASTIIIWKMMREAINAAKEATP